MNVLSSIQPLLRTPEPIPGESFRGYVLRLSEDNGCITPATMYGYAGLHHLQIRLADPPVEIIAALTAKPIERFSEIRYSIPDKVEGTLSGHLILKPYLQIRHPKICVECVKELGYIPALWDLMNIHACHIHRTKLITHCNSCTKKINWHRQGLLTCQCGKEITHSGETETSERKIDLIKLIASVVNLTALLDQDSITGMPFSRFSKMSLQTLLGLTIAFGSRKSVNKNNKNKRIANGLENSDLLLEAAANVLSEWPKNFLALFELNHQSKINKSSTFWDLNKDIYSRIFKMGYPENEVKFFRELISNYAVTKSKDIFVDHRIAKFADKDSIINKQKDGLMFSELVRKLGMHPATLRRRIKDGEVVFDTFKVGYKTYYVYDHEKHKPKKQGTKGELGQRASGVYIGIPVSVLKYIRSEGLFTETYSTEKSSCWSIEDLEDLKFLLLSKCDSVDSTNELLSISELFRLPCLKTKLEIIRGILLEQIDCFGHPVEIKDIKINKQFLMECFYRNKGYLSEGGT